jgi:hypothetical protein
MRRDTLRRRLGWWLRMLGDRVSPDTGPRWMSPYSFTIEPHRGIVLRQDGRGCPLWYMTEDHDRAHDDADDEHVVVNWRNAANGNPPYVRRAGGRQWTP